MNGRAGAQFKACKHEGPRELFCVAILLVLSYPSSSLGWPILLLPPRQPFTPCPIVAPEQTISKSELRARTHRNILQLFFLKQPA
ncbi:hypothetical protein FGIG_01412 [Fasciola gigantica]|uniref:Uncharacterized protein n=1 Tax=Fasciola gigantica TaxID=46835 RepID=A0A504YQW6_FASGI|nr:hypothetical protein FGIG_01412 [Fasciola gigantica]